MKILILNGSPLAGGNTSFLVQAFEQGAQEAGHEVIVQHVGAQKVAGCLHCEYCHQAGHGKCIQQDDMQSLYPQINAADVIVFASPIYYFTLSAQLQAVIQRCYAINHPAKAKGAVLLLSSYSPDVYTGAIAQYRDMLHYMGLKDLGIITADNTTNKTPAKEAEVKVLTRSLT